MTSTSLEVAKALEKEGAVHEGYYRGNLGASKLMRDHAAMDVLEGYELQDADEGARQFVVECHGEPERS